MIFDYIKSVQNNNISYEEIIKKVHQEFQTQLELEEEDYDHLQEEVITQKMLNFTKAKIQN